MFLFSIHLNKINNIKDYLLPIVIWVYIYTFINLCSICIYQHKVPCRWLFYGISANFHNRQGIYSCIDGPPLVFLIYVHMTGISACLYSGVYASVRNLIESLVVPSSLCCCSHLALDPYIYLLNSPEMYSYTYQLPLHYTQSSTGWQPVYMAKGNQKYVSDNIIVHCVLAINSWAPVCNSVVASYTI